MYIIFLIFSHSEQTLEIFRSLIVLYLIQVCMTAQVLERTFVEVSVKI